MNWKKLGLQERFLIKLEYIEHPSLDASQNLNILSLVLQLPKLGNFANENFKHL